MSASEKRKAQKQLEVELWNQLDLLHYVAHGDALIIIKIQEDWFHHR